jgi:hypothetical protein
MKINVVDCKRNEMINVKIELSEHMFVVVPEIVNHKFDYMKYRLMDIRKKYMDLYLENKGQYKVYEQQIYDEIKETLIKEMERIYKTEGVMYYTR